VKVIDWPYITESRLDEEIRLAEAGAYPMTYSGDEKNSLIQSGYLAVIFSYFLGITTGVSPCLLGSLVVMITATATTAGSATTSRYYATVFGSGLVTAYVIVAAGILFAGFHLPSGAGLSTTFYTVAGLITIGFGILQLGFIRLPFPAESWISHLFSRFNNLKGAFFLGIICAVLLSPCAGAPFLVLIDMFLILSSAPALGMVFAFGAGVLTPFLLITIISGSIPQERLIRYGGAVQKASGVLLIVFGIWLLMGA
jgi:cytochrome c biogenesis protein CcdA